MVTIFMLYEGSIPTHLLAVWELRTYHQDIRYTYGTCNRYVDAVCSESDLFTTHNNWSRQGINVLLGLGLGV